MSMSPVPGILRFVGTGDPALTGSDLQVEVQQRDGVWVPLYGVCSAIITIKTDDFVRARMEVLVGTLETAGVVPDGILWRDHRSRWQRFLAWVRGQ